MTFADALDYANRVYLANRSEFDAVILPLEKTAPEVKKLKPPSFPKTAATPFGGQACKKGYQIPRLRWTEHRGANP